MSRPFTARLRPVMLVLGPARAGLVLGLAGAGLVLFASSAAADVTITPSQAQQGGSTSVTFLVRNQRAGALTTKVQVDLPLDTPIAEVYPMSVADWAPRIIYRKVDQELPGIHGSGLTSATSSVIWERASDALAPPAVESLRLEMGPLPTVDTFVFTVVQTYSDGTVQRWHGPGPAGSSSAGTVLTLTPAAAGQADQGHAGHQGGQQVPAVAGTSGSGTRTSADGAQSTMTPPLLTAVRWAARGVGALALVSLGVVGTLMVPRWRQRVPVLADAQRVGAAKE